MIAHLTSIRARITTAWEQLRTSFWFVPALMSVGAAILAMITLGIDRQLGQAALDGLSWIYSGSPEGARSLLSTVASTAITVAGTTFSITIAALSLASSQFGPRLLRNFVRDTGNQVVLGTFVATFLYCLLVLRTIRGLEDTRVVPHLSVTIGVLLAIADLAVLIYFIHHVAMAIRADQVISAVGQDLDEALERLFPEDLGRGASRGATAEPPPPGAQALALDHDGYIQMIDAETLMELTGKHDLTVWLLHRPGDFVMAGEPIALVDPAGRLSEKIAAALRGTVMLGSERSAQQDLLFVVNQLVEVAARALSPGINDPFTAISCLDRLGAMLYRVARRSLPDGRRYDEDGQLRIVARPVEFAELVQAAFGQIRSYGHASLPVMVRLLDILGRLRAATDDEARGAPLLRQIDLVYESSRPTLVSDGDRQVLDQHYQAARR